MEFHEDVIVIIGHNGATVTDDGEYYCEITGACGIESSVPVEITVDPATLITTQPISRSRS